MKKPDPQLRDTAEQQLAETPIPLSPLAAARTVAELLHDLQVHQVELEMQNEALLQANVALEESRDRFVDLYEFAPVGYLSVNSDGRIAEINLTGVRLLGVDRSTLLRTRFTTFVVREDQDRWTQLFMKVRSEGGESSLDLSLRRADGTVFQVQLDCARQKFGTGKQTLRIAITDVSRRKQAEDERNRFFTLSQDLFCTTGPDGYLRELNPAWEKTLGYTNSELQAKPYAWFLHPDDLQPTQRVVESIRRGTTTDLFENRFRCRDGSYRWLQWAHPAREGELLYGVARDITDRKLAEDALHSAGALQRAIFNSAYFSCIATDASGLIQIFNRGAERLFGYTAAEVVNQVTPARLHDSQEVIARARDLSLEFGIPIAPGFDALVYKAARGIEDNYEVTKVRKDGTRFPAVLSVTALRDSGAAIIGYLLIGSDNTERTRAEQDRERLQQILLKNIIALEEAKVIAENANRAKSIFISSMSHELRTPLNAILGFAQLLALDSRTMSPAQVSGIEQISKAGWFLLELINEILDLSLVESGKLVLAMETVPLSGLLSECLAMTELQAKRKNIGVSFPQLDQTCIVKADRTRLKQVVVNLLSNAIKYNRAGGTVTIACAPLGANSHRITINDSGEGLPPEKVAQLFQPFNRLGQETGQEEGTGIGLVVTKRLVELMGGEIGVESAVGAGSQFWFTLNAADEPKSLPILDRPSEQPPLIEHDPPLRTLLYIEDNPANMQLVASLVARRPATRLICAGNGAHGLELAARDQPEVILLDIQLPDMGGVEVLQLLRDNPLTARIPVIAITANALLGDIEAGLQAGFFRYLTKPFLIDDFMMALDQALEAASGEQSRAAKQWLAHP